VLKVWYDLDAPPEQHAAILAQLKVAWNNAGTAPGRLIPSRAPSGIKRFDASTPIAVERVCLPP